MKSHIPVAKALDEAADKLATDWRPYDPVGKVTLSIGASILKASPTIAVSTKAMNVVGDVSDLLFGSLSITWERRPERTAEEVVALVRTAAFVSRNGYFVEVGLALGLRDKDRRAANSAAGRKRAIDLIGAVREKYSSLLRRKSA